MKDNLATIERPSVPRRGGGATPGLVRIIGGLASLKVTVTMFAMAIVVVLAGTLAQVDKGIWIVVREYFRTPITWIDFQLFFPRDWNVPGGFYFPGGFTIGAILFANLLAAHISRFKVQARRGQLAAGLALIGLGTATTVLIIMGGSGKAGSGQTSVISWSTLWLAIKGALIAVWLAAAYGFAMIDRSKTTERRLLAAVLGGLGSMLGWLLYNNDDMLLGAPSLRILWQLIQGGLAGLLLLAGCLLLFRKRAGIVLLHAGIGLLMANELVVHFLHVESQMTIREGQVVNYSEDIRTVELAVVDPDYSADEQRVVVLPETHLTESGTIISDSLLPFDIRVDRWLPNASVPRRIEPEETSLATAGVGVEWTVDEVRAGTGTDTSGAVDQPAAYVTLLEKSTGRQLGTYLLSTSFSIQDFTEEVRVDGQSYDLALRFTRLYKPYSIELLDVRFDKYPGTTKARNYSSDIRLVDASTGVDRSVRIWMNNPLRYGSETFYQSEFKTDMRTGQEVTGLQIVKNTGWMIPYVACMLVAVGMLAHFALTLLRFLARQSRSGILPTGAGRGDTAGPTGKGAAERRGGVAARLVPWIALVVAGAWAGSKAVPRSAEEDAMRLHEFGSLPVVYEGRVKPFDTLSRNSLRVISGRQTFKDASGTRQPAIRWLLDLIADPEAADKHRVFYIQDTALLQVLQLDRRPGYRYAVEEFRGRLREFDRQSRKAYEMEPPERGPFERKVLELDNKLRLYLSLRESFTLPQLREDHIQEDIRTAAERRERLSRMNLPHAVPPHSSDEQWEPYTNAAVTAWVKSMIGQPPNPATRTMTAMLVHYRQGNAGAFNHALERYRELLAEIPAPNLDMNKTRYEVFFNRFEPFFSASILYLLAFALGALGWLGWTGPLNRTALYLILLALAVHTFALISRIYISGRPPVTNLYSSAVFVGWGCVVLGIILEYVYRMGVGITIASIGGFSTLLIAHFLSGDGDTFVVLQAVLDTQFWLATHVVCISLGYATTFIAGALGILYILRGTLTPSLSPRTSHELARMMYGTLCFAILFSFVGTVLGGLWADDSWGRFWGWDPKENGALIIVLWNALVLHARWDGMIRDRGLAVLAVGGNIATSWSWFGVNELGAGLHSYGFTEGIALALVLFVASQLLIIALGCLPRHRWWSQA